MKELNYDEASNVTGGALLLLTAVSAGAILVGLAIETIADGDCDCGC